MSNEGENDASLLLNSLVFYCNENSRENKSLIALVAGYDSLDGPNGEVICLSQIAIYLAKKSQPRETDISFSVGSKHVLTLNSQPMIPMFREKKDSSIR